MITPVGRGAQSSAICRANVKCQREVLTVRPCEQTVEQWGESVHSAASGVVVGPPSGRRSEQGHHPVRRTLGGLDGQVPVARPHQVDGRDLGQERGGSVGLHRFQSGADLRDGRRGVPGQEAPPGIVRRDHGQQRADPGCQLWQAGVRLGEPTGRHVHPHRRGKLCHAGFQLGQDPHGRHGVILPYARPASAPRSAPGRLRHSATATVTERCRRAAGQVCAQASQTRVFQRLRDGRSAGHSERSAGPSRTLTDPFQRSVTAGAS